MHLEVEQKFWVDSLAAFRELLVHRGATLGETVLQIDEYFAHPSRNFAQTDEALRIRRVGDQNFITYKGPRLDSATKTRREIELPVSSGEAGFHALEELLVALGFTPVAAVRKQRQTAQLVRNDQAILVALDHVEGLGEFVELEMEASVATVDSARDLIAALARELGLLRAERRSYLELLLSA
jgi:adenylate cyclase class 2